MTIVVEPKKSRRGRLKNGATAAEPWDSERARAAVEKRWAKRREAQEQAERAAVELAAERFKSELMRSVETWSEVRDDRSQPGSTRIQAADRFVDRALGPVGQKLELVDASSPWADMTPEAKRVILAQLQAKLALAEQNPPNVPHDNS